MRLAEAVLGSREMLRAFQPGAGYNDLPDWPFHELADSLGGVGIRVRTRCELADAMQHAVADRGRFVLIDAVMERGRMSETLSRYVQGFERRRSGSTSC